MLKKSLLIILMALLLASCTRANDADKEPEVATPELVEEPEEIKYTGEIIADGFFEEQGRIYFIPDKETRELLKNEYPYTIDAGESIPLDYDDIGAVKDLPQELGVYKVEVEADFKTEGIVSELKSIMLAEEIGTVEYEGKLYPTNDLDETVTPKDRVCNLIVSNVRKIGDGGVMIEFEGEIESEGFYNVHNGGELFNYLNIGRIVPDKESLKNFPTYKGVGNDWSVYFAETNELYKQLAEHSAIGRGKFKSTGYRIVYNYGMGAGPGEKLTEIVYLDENYKGLFDFNEDSITAPLVNEQNKYKDGFMDKYAIVYHSTDIDGYRTKPTTRDYYFLGYDELSKIKILSTDEFDYGLKENNGSLNEFELITDSGTEKSHIISFKYFDKNSNGYGKDLILKKYDFGMFMVGDSTIRVFENDEVSGMTADDINIEYHCTEDYPEELVRIISRFSGEIALTGKLTIYYDEAFGYNKIYFNADDESVKMLPIHVEDTREQGSMIFTNDNLEEMLGTEPFEKNAEITIKNYNIHYAATEASNTAELVSVHFLE